MANLDLILDAIEAFERDWYAEHPDGKDVEANWDEYQEEKRQYIRDYLRSVEESNRELIEELEEEQHRSGFYAFQDLMAMHRREMQ